MEPLHQDWVEELLLSWICQQLQDYQQQYLHPGNKAMLEGDLWGPWGSIGAFGGDFWGLGEEIRIG